MVFPFVRAFLDRETDVEQEYSVTQVHMIFSKFERWLRRKDSKETMREELLGIVIVEVQNFKT